MAFSLVLTRAMAGITAVPVQVEIQLANGLPQFNLVGLPDAQVRESRERVRAALTNCGFQFPARRITVNLAPANLPKQSNHFDLPIALGILAASGQIPDTSLQQLECAGELALSGELRAFSGALPMAIAAARMAHPFLVPQVSAAQASLCGQSTILAAKHLLEVCAHLSGERVLMPFVATRVSVPEALYPDLADVRGQQYGRRALEIAAAGGHHLLLAGPPGCGKSMLAERLAGIAAPMSENEALELAALQSTSGEHGSTPCHWGRRPLRSPHHTSTVVAMAGGGVQAGPGEISLAHCGFLHLDEMPEFDRRVLEVLREPMETGVITISRALRKVTYPARFQLVGTMNPCPCGYLGHASGRCHCTPDQVRRYSARISGPLLDRIDLVLHLPALTPREMEMAPAGETSACVRARVVVAYQGQIARQGQLNSQLQGENLVRHTSLDQQTQALLNQALQHFSLSARAMQSVLRVARTIADLDQKNAVDRFALAEALSFRSKQD